MYFDTIIVGAGITGLYLAYKLLKEGEKVMLVDRNNYLGGRIYTHHDKYNSKKFNYEAGAARFANIHKNLINVIL